MHVDVDVDVDVHVHNVNSAHQPRSSGSGRLHTTSRSRTQLDRAREWIPGSSAHASGSQVETAAAHTHPEYNLPGCLD